MTPEELDQIVNATVRRMTPTMSRLAAAAVASAVDFGAVPQPVRRPGTVGTSLVKPGQAGTVKLDGDVNSITAQNTSGYSVLPGARVMILLEPPHGAFIESAITPPGIWNVIDQVPTLTVAGGISFQNIDQNYKSLRLEVHVRSAGNPGITADTTFVKINADAGATYYDHEQQASNATTAGVGLTNRTGGFFAGYVPSSISSTARAGHQIIEIPGYREKIFAAHTGWWTDGTLDTNSLTYTGNWLWAPAVMAAITRLDVIPGTGTTFMVGSWARLWAAG